MHAGPAIAVNANDRLDYFGRTVNLAARVERESAGGDVVLLRELWEDVADEVAGAVLAERFTAPLRGIEGEGELVRLRPRGENVGFSPAAGEEAQNGWPNTRRSEMTDEPRDTQAPGTWHEPGRSDADLGAGESTDAPSPGGSSQGLGEAGARGTARGGVEASGETDLPGRDDESEAPEPAA